jgi:hypothetical protein
MFIVKRIITLAALVACLVSTDGNAQTTLYVSTKGNDRNAGTESKPFASISTAVAKARKIAGAVDIRIYAGKYYLSQPISFTADDSRKDGEPLTLTNVDQQQVIISGSTVLKNLNWKIYKNGIWQTKISQELIFDAMFVNGALKHMARYPNYDTAAQFLNGTAADAISNKRVARWKAPAGGYVHALHNALWGDLHYKILSKKDSDQLVLEGGWQNNRRSDMHDRYRYVENIFEELDTANEWYYDNKAKILYYFPPKGMDLKQAKFEVPQIAHLFEFKGTEEKPVKNIKLSGLTLTGTLRTFMQNKEPLLRSDWTIYRGGAVLLEGAIQCRIQDCVLHGLGSNAVFFSKFNRDCEVSGCEIYNIGASGVCMVGDPEAVRSPSFEYNEHIPLSKMDLTPGPKTNNFPKDCQIDDNLMYNLGCVEKQSTGIELSMCMDIMVSHNTIYDVPRAGINVSEGTWGGHIIQYNDVFNTVKESGDHGSFNSWGRDRYWEADYKQLDSIISKNTDLAFLDVIKPIVLRNNRFRCDHGWDIDLDDGSSNYRIYNNLCLNGGIKLREGVGRIVENNIMVNNSVHPHVWFENSHDVFRYNLVGMGYQPVNITHWGKEVDYNAFPDEASLSEAHLRGTDQHSVYGPLSFMDPAKGDFRVKDGAAALSIGFKNFDMDSFGVISMRLKSVAKKPIFPKIVVMNNSGENETIDFMGATVKNLLTAGEQSATGMDKINGVLVIVVNNGSVASSLLRPNDVILNFNGLQVNTIADLQKARETAAGKSTEIVIFRNQQLLKQIIAVPM